MPKMLFLPRGYLTVVALFWAYDSGLFDSIARSPNSPTATSISEWLKVEEKAEPEITPIIDSMPPAEFATLKDEILQELSAFDQQSTHSSQTSFDSLQMNSVEEDLPQKRSEAPRGIKNYLHKIFR